MFFVILQDKPTNSIIAFKDNSRAIRGFPVKTLQPKTPGKFGGSEIPNPLVDLTNLLFDY